MSQALVFDADYNSFWYDQNNVKKFTVGLQHELHLTAGGTWIDHTYSTNGSYCEKNQICIQYYAFDLLLHNEKFDELKSLEGGSEFLESKEIK